MENIIFLLYYITNSKYIFQFVCLPTYTSAQIEGMSDFSKLVRAADDTTYRPGLLGLNNIKANDYCNVVLHVGIYLGKRTKYLPGV